MSGDEPVCQMLEMSCGLIKQPEVFIRVGIWITIG